MAMIFSTFRIDGVNGLLYTFYLHPDRVNCRRSIRDIRGFHPDRLMMKQPVAVFSQLDESVLQFLTRIPATT